METIKVQYAPGKKTDVRIIGKDRESSFGVSCNTCSRVTSRPSLERRRYQCEFIREITPVENAVERAEGCEGYRSIFGGTN